MNKINQKIKDILENIGITGDVQLSKTPNPELGDIALACFPFAKQMAKSPTEIATEIASKINTKVHESLEQVEVAGPYVNFTFDTIWLAKTTLEEITPDYGSHSIGEGKKVLVEYGCPNPMKAFHLGHLKNLITGESVARVFANAGYKVVRVNYQGDVGMQIAKSLWGIFDKMDEFNSIRNKSIKERVEFLGQAYAHGAEHFEKGEQEKKEVVEYNTKVYENDPSILDVYNEAKNWSLEYFDSIYKTLDTKFDCLYFESEVFKRGKELILGGVKDGIFIESQGAIIYEGEKKQGLHDRVFVNSKGYPTYEAKDIALAEKHFQDHNPDKVIHVVGKEQTEYFKVVFAAMAEVLPETAGKEYHLIGGYLQLKGEQKMSSRLGNIITGDALLLAVQNRVREIMSENNENINEEVLEKVSTAALKYAMLKSDVTQDVSFDMETSVNTAGDSGPYLLYIIARVNSIIQKNNQKSSKFQVPSNIHPSEKALLLSLVQYPDITKKAVESLDPSKIARYLFTLSQDFNTFYHDCPVIKAEEKIKAFRLGLIEKVLIVMEHGLNLLGIESVEEM